MNRSDMDESALCQLAEGLGLDLRIARRVPASRARVAGFLAVLLAVPLTLVVL